jgi:hypothetical protein
MGFKEKYELRVILDIITKVLGHKIHEAFLNKD